MLMLVLSDLHRRAGSATVTVRAGASERKLYIGQGHLLSADSDVVAERLGNMLATEGKLDPDLIEPVAAEARRRGTLLGSQLIADGLLTPAEVAAALERQVRFRFEFAVGTPGVVSVEELKPVPKIVKTPLGVALVALFRERLALEAVVALVSNRDRQLVQFNVQSVKELQLRPAELLICKRLAAGESFETVLEGAIAPEHVTRTVAILVALGLWA